MTNNNNTNTKTRQQRNGVGGHPSYLAWEGFFYFDVLIGVENNYNHQHTCVSENSWNLKYQFALLDGRKRKFCLVLKVVFLSHY